MVDDPAHYRWTRYRANALWQVDDRLTPHALYMAMGRSDKARQAAYRQLFRAHLDTAAIDDIRLAPNQNHPLGNERFHTKIEKMTGIRREAKPRGRPRGEDEESSLKITGQPALSLWSTDYPEIRLPWPSVWPHGFEPTQRG